jgi:hypothetical protein
VAAQEPAPRFNDAVTEKLMSIAEDAAWIMQNSAALSFSEAMFEIYDKLLQLKGYSSLSGRKNQNLLLDKLLPGTVAKSD